MTSKEGHKYEGGWIDDKYHGYGKQTLANGTVVQVTMTRSVTGSKLLMARNFFSACSSLAGGIFRKWLQTEAAINFTTKKQMMLLMASAVLISERYLKYAHCTARFF
jgi:hypothetical protein